MNIERLLRLADYLERVVAKTPELFDMSSWVYQLECGTVCCAFGHACSIPEFAAAGLRLGGNWQGAWAAGNVFFGHSSGLSAAEAFFGLNSEDAWSLFSDSAYPQAEQIADGGFQTPEDVATRIRDMVAAHVAGSPS